MTAGKRVDLDGKIAPAGAEIGDATREIARQVLGKRREPASTPSMREHAGRGGEAAFQQRPASRVSAALAKSSA